jgi:hypothetical protein
MLFAREALLFRGEQTGREPVFDRSVSNRRSCVGKILIHHEASVTIDRELFIIEDNQKATLGMPQSLAVQTTLVHVSFVQARHPFPCSMTQFPRGRSNGYQSMLVFILVFPHITYSRSVSKNRLANKLAQRSSGETYLKDASNSTAASGCILSTARLECC